MSDIFISYASEDISRAETLSKALEEQGWSVWWDRTIPPGKTFDQVIEEAINAARCVIVLWSEKSIKSDWVKEEANIGKQRNVLVPAKIDPVDPPLGFGRIQAADLTDWKTEKDHAGFLSLLNAISEIAEPSSKRDESVEVTKLDKAELEKEAKIEEKPTYPADTRQHETVGKEPPVTAAKTPTKKRFAIGTGVIALIIILGVIGWFLFPTYTITVTSGPNGKIIPENSVSLSRGDSKSFEIRPNPGYEIEEIKVDGKPIETTSPYPFKNVTSNRTISATFAKRSYKITASAETNGSISPAGEIKVSHGESLSFSVKPSKGYRIADVKVDGKSVGAESKPTLRKVTDNHTISASFVKKSYKIINENSSKYLAVAAGGKGDGERVVIWDDARQNDIRWYLERKGENRYKIRNVNSGKYLAVAGVSNKNGANVVQWSDDSQGDKLWDFEKVHSSCFKIRNYNSGKYLGVSDSQKINGAFVNQYQDFGQKDIVWCLK